MPLLTTDNIAYPEYRAISELRHVHPDIHAGNLRAMVAFGDLVATGQSKDIHLLEVVEDWTGDPYIVFGSMAALPLRGRLYLYVLTPDQFEHPDQKPLRPAAWSSADLLARVVRSYAILVERPPNYAHDILANLEERPGFGERGDAPEGNGHAGPTWLPQ